MWCGCYDLSMANTLAQVQFLSQSLDRIRAKKGEFTSPGPISCHYQCRKQLIIRIPSTYRSRRCLYQSSKIQRQVHFCRPIPNWIVMPRGRIATLYPLLPRRFILSISISKMYSKGVKTVSKIHSSKRTTFSVLKSMKSL